MKKYPDFLKLATVFKIDSIHNIGIYIEARGQIDGSTLWVVTDGSEVWGKDGDFHYEPIPSSRSKEFIELTRYETIEQAYDAWFAKR
jgi:hypothetical protein